MGQIVQNQTFEMAGCCHVWFGARTDSTYTFPMDIMAPAKTFHSNFIYDKSAKTLSLHNKMSRMAQ